MAKSEEWWKGLFVGSAIAGCVMFVLMTALFFIQLSTISGYEKVVTDYREEVLHLNAGLVKCQETSKRNYAVATAAQEENRQNLEALRKLIVAYQAQIQKGQARAGLAEFLLKLLVR